jgi:branched-chain amino acid transport system ATP-binding protein
VREGVVGSPTTPSPRSRIAADVSTPILQLQNVSVRFGALPAVDDVSLELRQGERRAVIGPNGAGKTTLFNAITGVIRPSSGRVLLQGRNITRMPPNRRAYLGIGRTFQITNLFANLTVAENMRLALRGTSPSKFHLFAADRLAEQDAARLDQALETSRLAHRRQATVREMSYGEQRQLELAMALVSRPRLLLLDEPAAGLSAMERTYFAEIVKGLPKDLTMVLIEHDMDLALRLVDYVSVLNRGRLLVEAEPANIRANEAVQEVYLGKPHHARRA